MKWALIFWVTGPANFTVHSVYLDQDKCLAQQAYYQERFKNMQAQCKPAREVQLNNPTNVKVFKDTVPG